MPVRPSDVRPSTRTVLTLTVAVVLGLGATACGSDTDDGPSEDPATTSATDPGDERPSDGTGEGPSAGKPEAVTTVRGTVQVGVEPGCRLLRTGDEVYLLVGVDAASAPEGQRMVATGTRSPDLMTTCQEGVPFQVRSLGPDDAG